MFLVSTLYLQGAIALGLLPNPVTNKADVQLDQAKHAIDMLAMLQQKTEGNRTPEESQDLEAALHELRLAYVGEEVRNRAGTAIRQSATIDTLVSRYNASLLKTLRAEERIVLPGTRNGFVGMKRLRSSVYPACASRWSPSYGGQCVC